MSFISKNPVLQGTSSRVIPHLNDAGSMTSAWRNFHLLGVFPKQGGMPMKRKIAGLLLLVGMSVPALAYDGERGLRRDIRHDEARIARDRHELRRDLNHGYYGAAHYERRQLRRDYRELHRDRSDLYWR
jgi:hypothetical protein